ncbi:unnamed protein product [Caenorhabditis auriculariae]|uniref:Uncharacterized protein n=1 Tax=Caenorhabditis auriculariae TaxID=2777116 RepID=A0A8S1H3V4_9PELO|nr:unnamed protein product [Caenorhabditis auriculariae]
MESYFRLLIRQSTAMVIFTVVCLNPRSLVTKFALQGRRENGGGGCVPGIRGGRWQRAREETTRQTVGTRKPAAPSLVTFAAAADLVQLGLPFPSRQ